MPIWMLLLAKLVMLALVPYAFYFTWIAVRFWRMTPSEWEYEKLRGGRD